MVLFAVTGFFESVHLAVRILIHEIKKVIT